MPAKFEPVVLTNESGDPIGIKRGTGGWPVVKVVGEDGSESEAEFDIDSRMHALSQSDAESKARRLALERIGKALGVEVGRINSGALETIANKADELGSALPAEREELERLRRMEEAGKLGDDADEKIRTMAEDQAKQLSQDRLNEMESKLAKVAAERANFESELGTTKAQMTRDRVRRAIEAKYDQHKDKFREDARATCIEVAENACRWRTSDKTDETTGLQQVFAVDENGDMRKEDGGLTPFDLDYWFNKVAPKRHRALFAPTNSSPDGDPQSLPGGAKSYADMSEGELDSRLG